MQLSAAAFPSALRPNSARLNFAMHRLERSSFSMTRRIGLLACDSIWEPLRSRHGDYPEMFTAWLRGTGAEFELVTYAAYQGELPQAPNECDGWIVSGSRAGVYEPLPWISPLMGFVRAAHAARRTMLGICFGHQLLAHTLGGRTARAPDGWGIGNLRVALRPTTAALPPTPTLDLFMAHQDQVMQLPPNAVWLAEAVHCRYAMFALSDHVLGLQPHPEFTAAFMDEMTREETFRLSDTQRAAALDSYMREVDASAIGHWAAAFLGLGATKDAESWVRWHNSLGAD